jgi:hypothetical protein
MDELIKEKEHLAADNDKKQQLIKSLHQELADDDDDPLLHRIRRECERCVKDCEERLKKSQVEGEMQSILIDKIKLEMRERMPTMPREVPLPCSMSRSAMS